MADYLNEAATTLNDLTRDAMHRATARGIVLAQSKYTTDKGLLVVTARYGVGSVLVETTLSEKGKPAVRVLPIDAIDAIAERMARVFAA